MEISKIYNVPHPRPVVFAAWVSSDTVIPPATVMDILPEVGGHYRLLMKTPEFEVSNQGRFLIVSPDEHVLYTWQWSGDEEVSEIDVRFHDEGSGTRIELVHSKLLSESSRDNHDKGWDSYIAGFTAFLDAV